MGGGREAGPVLVTLHSGATGRQSGAEQGEGGEHVQVGDAAAREHAHSERIEPGSLLSESCSQNNYNFTTHFDFKNGV